MKEIDLKKMGWNKVYQPFQFHFEKFVIEDYYPREMSDDDCFNDLEERLDRQAIRKYPHLEKDLKSRFTEAMSDVAQQVPQREVEFIDRNKPLPIAKVQKDDTALSPDAALAECINDCKDLKNLEFFSKGIQKQEKSKQTALWVLYEKKKEELTQKQTA